MSKDAETAMWMVDDMAIPARSKCALCCHLWLRTEVFATFNADGTYEPVTDTMGWCRLENNMKVWRVSQPEYYAKKCNQFMRKT